MKTAFEHQRLAKSLALLGFLAGMGMGMPILSLPAAAQVATAAAPVPVAQAAQTTVPATAIVSPPEARPADASPALATAAIAVAPPKEDKEMKGLGRSEDKISDSVKSLAKRLSDADTMTLDDLNAARQTVAKIEALIEIEKHMNELEKLRSERENKGTPSLPISAGMLTQPGGAPQTTMPVMPLPMSSTIPASAVQGALPVSFGGGPEVVRITGVGGRFSAVVKGSDGVDKTVSVGDTVDGATVTSITASGVELMRRDKKQTLRVKNVHTVFGNVP